MYVDTYIRYVHVPPSNGPASNIPASASIRETRCAGQGILENKTKGRKFDFSPREPFHIGQIPTNPLQLSGVCFQTKTLFYFTFQR